MINQNKVLGLIGLCMKAGKISAGADAVKETIEKHKAKLVIVAEDASENLKEEFSYKCKQKNVQIVIYEKIENLSRTIGKSNKAVICIKDNNLGKEIYKIICGGEAIG